MKKQPLRHKASKNLRGGISLLLCLLLSAGLCSAPVRGAEPQETPSVSLAQESPETTAPGEEAPETTEPSFGEDPPVQAQETPEDNQEPEPQPEPEKVTLTFQIGGHGAQTLEVEKGQYPAGIPEIPALPGAQVLGWYDANGALVDPGASPAEKDASYTARWSRHVEELLNTDDHFAYVQGYNGMFKPNRNVTRAESAQMLYSLLRRKDWEQKTFSDVKNQWYSNAVKTMAGLGVIRGYTDGTFQPSREITRAEFVTMAVACDTVSEFVPSFPDVKTGSWAAPYIATAAARGWISGYPDGKFHPDDKITRAQAVTILNNMLGRSADKHVLNKPDVKNFYDVYPGGWAYGGIVEATTSHTASASETGETWSQYESDTAYPKKSQWIQDGASLYYLDAKTRKFLRGEQTIDGKKYLLDSSTGAAFTGFRMQGGWRRYYKNGLLKDDISGLGVVSGPYFIKVYKNSNYLIVFAKDKNGRYNTPVRAIRTSCGYATPVGTYYTPYKYRWLQMVGGTWAQWCTQIQGSYLFHSVPNWTHSNMDLEIGEYNHLGETRSMGCIRMNCRDAKWVYDNCSLGTKVTITTSESSGPLAKPAGIQIPSWHSWDPTDPTAYWRCQQKGCH